jgi:DNA-binding CsgD family transcriptional regulator
LNKIIIKRKNCNLKIIKQLNSNNMKTTQIPLKSKKKFSITKREEQVVGLIKSGYRSKEVAEQLGISIRTVEVHRYNLLRKTTSHNTVSMLVKLSNYNVKTA